MKPVRLPRLRCALLGLLPLWARDGAMRTAGSGTGGVVEASASVGGWKRVGETVVTKKS